MKLTMSEVDAKLTAAWKREVFLVPYRLAGNRYTYTATDHVEHVRPLETSWERRVRLFEPPGLQVGRGRLAGARAPLLGGCRAGRLADGQDLLFRVAQQRRPQALAGPMCGVQPPAQGELSTETDGGVLLLAHVSAPNNRCEIAFGDPAANNNTN